MNKKIKIIDIFNIISKGDYEALPLNIEVDGKKYNWDTLEHFYNRKDSDREDLLELAREYDTVTFLDINVEVLDNNLEDNTEEIEGIEEIDLFDNGQGFNDIKIIIQSYDRNFQQLNDVVNKIGKAVNKLRKEKKDAV